MQLMLRNLLAATSEAERRKYRRINATGPRFRGEGETSTGVFRMKGSCTALAVTWAFAVLA